MEESGGEAKERMRREVIVYMVGVRGKKLRKCGGEGEDEIICI